MKFDKTISEYGLKSCTISTSVIRTILKSSFQNILMDILLEKKKKSRQKYQKIVKEFCNSINIEKKKIKQSE